MASSYSWLLLFILTFFVLIIVIYFLVRFITGSKTFGFMIVNDKEGSGTGVTGPVNYGDLLGKVGIATTDLRLSGKGRFESREFQIVARDEYIKKGSLVTVDHIEGNKIFVVLKG